SELIRDEPDALQISDVRSINVTVRLQLHCNQIREIDDRIVGNITNGRPGVRGSVLIVRANPLIRNDDTYTALWARVVPLHKHVHWETLNGQDPVFYQDIVNWGENFPPSQQVNVRG